MVTFLKLLSENMQANSKVQRIDYICDSDEDILEVFVFLTERDLDVLDSIMAAKEVQKQSANVDDVELLVFYDPEQHFEGTTTFFQRSN